ncbi:VTT domain-containing protein [Serpentinicella sp. ANB-PHB4]|uniref:TVP38/TMEM64 family protein n=1 Tax=Serpentinicella sp. ANB-PHB4 TaxID=3074076 RepID=UPI00285D5C51|nr:VTT domain-containing protein [Serpentinicella sp. ANB-PHB4]MDR5658004.1 VTT domain-containing protein [Serpentinicella sp. ANB-PHB4]
MKHKKFINILIIVMLLLVCIYINQRLNLNTKDDLMELFDQFRESQYIGIIYIVLTVILSVLCVPISWMKALGGVLFGVRYGFIYSLTAATISASISFFISSHLGKEAVQRIYRKRIVDGISNKNQKYFKLIQGIKPVYIVLLRNIYFVPFSLTNYLLGITNIPFKKYILYSIVGMVPGTFTYTYFFARSINMHESPTEMLLPLFISAIYFLSLYIIKKKVNLKGMAEKDNLVESK